MSEPWTAYSFLPARVRTARWSLLTNDQRAIFCDLGAGLSLFPEVGVVPVFTGW